MSCKNNVLTDALDRDRLFPGQTPTILLFDQTTLLFGTVDFVGVLSDPQAAMDPTHGPKFQGQWLQVLRSKRHSFVA